MAGQDYYNILGLDKNASDDDIKKAYRKLAMKHHPDKTKGNTHSEDKFKRMSEAYAVLGDKEKRKQYDNFGSEGFHERFSQEDIFRNFNVGDIFGDFAQNDRFSFGNFQFGRRQRSIKGSNVIYEIPLTLKEIVFGANKIITLKYSNSTENLSVKIPSGMIPGKKLRLGGRGEKSQFGGSPGDLFIKSIILPDKEFVVREYDLNISRTIKLTEALLGTFTLIPTVEGGQLNLKIPAGTKHKTKMRLSGHGLPYMNKSLRGDLYVTINVKMPTDLSGEQKKLIENLSGTGL